MPGGGRRAAGFLPGHADVERLWLARLETGGERAAEVLAFAPGNNERRARTAEAFLPAVGEPGRGRCGVFVAGDDFRARLAQQIAPGVSGDGCAVQAFGPRHSDGRAPAAVGDRPGEPGFGGEWKAGRQREANLRFGLGRDAMGGGGFGGRRVGDFPGGAGVQGRRAIDGVVVVGP